MKVYIQEHLPDYTLYGINGVEFNITNFWDTYTLEFTSTFSAGNDARLRFWMLDYDDPGDEFWFDEVSLREL